MEKKLPMLQPDAYRSLEGAPEAAWDVSLAKDRRVLAWTEEADAGYQLFIAGDGGVALPENCSYLFQGYTALTRLDFSGVDTSRVKNMDYLLAECPDLQVCGIEHWDVRRVRSWESFLPPEKTIGGRPWREFFEKGKR